MRIRFALVACLLLVGSVLPMAAQSPTGLAKPSNQKANPSFVTRNCVAATPKLSWVATDGQETTNTTSTTFVDLAPLSITFNLPTQGGKSCLKVDVSAEEFAAAGGELMYMRALLDGNEMLPGEIQFAGDDDENGNGEWARTMSAHFYAFGVPPGNHTVDIQWKTLLGNEIFAHNRTLSVIHK